MGKIGRPKKQDKDKKVKYGISIDKYLFDKMKNEEISISKFIQNLVKEYYEKNKDVRKAYCKAYYKKQRQELLELRELKKKSL